MRKGRDDAPVWAGKGVSILGGFAPFGIGREGVCVLWMLGEGTAAHIVFQFGVDVVAKKATNGDGAHVHILHLWGKGMR